MTTSPTAIRRIFSCESCGRCHIKATVTNSSSKCPHCGDMADYYKDCVLEPSEPVQSTGLTHEDTAFLKQLFGSDLYKTNPRR